MPYTPQTWTNAPSTTTPISAARLAYIESGVQTAQADVDALGGFETVGMTGGLRGEVVPQNEPAVWGPATRTLATTTRTWVLRYSPSREFVITLAKWDVTVAASVDDNVELAVYSGDLTTRLATSGVQAGQLNGTGIKGVNLSYTFDPAVVYYLAFKAPVALGGTGASVNARTCNGISTTLFGTTVPTALAGFIDSLSSPLPTSITAASVNWTALSTFPLIALREV